MFLVLGARPRGELRPERQVVAIYGISWLSGMDFRLLGLQVIRKDESE